MLSRGGAGSAQAFWPILQTIDSALRAGDRATATRLSCEALDAGHVHPVLLHLRAIRKKQNGLAESAFADIQRALQIAPQSPDLLAEAADSLNAAGEYQRAVVLADAALAIDPRHADAWHRKGYAHHMRTELESAVAAFCQAVRFDPRLADAHARLANIAAGQGNLSDARSFAARALAIEPNNSIAVLACVAADLAEERLEEARRRLDTVLSDPAALPPIRAAATSQAGDVCDALGLTDEAFDAYRSAGELWKSYYAPQVRKSGPDPIAVRYGPVVAALQALHRGLSQ